MLSAALVAYVAASADIAAFVAQSDAAIDYRQLRQQGGVVHDDVMLGYWLEAAGRQRGAVNVTFAFVNARTPNADCVAGSGNGMYKPPTNSSVLLHNIKNPKWLRYVWRVVGEREPYRNRECLLANNERRREQDGRCVERFGTMGRVSGPGAVPLPAGARARSTRLTSRVPARSKKLRP